MKIFNYLLVVSASLLIVGVKTKAEAQDSAACIMSISNPGTCLNGPIDCSGSEAQIRALYGDAVASLCGSVVSQSIQCESSLNIQADTYNEQLVENEASRLNAFKALERSQARIRALKRQLRASRLR